MSVVESVIAHYGAAVVLIGSALEGETVVVTAGLLAHQGLIDVRLVALAAFAGSFLGDEAWFWAGRRFADSPFVARQRQRTAFARALAEVEKHPVAFILAFRFLYGLRTVSPLAIGVSRVPTRTFMALNAVAAAVWAVAITAVGWFFGQTAEAMLGRMDRAEHKLLVGFIAGLAIAALAGFAVRRFWFRGQPSPGG